MNRAVVFTAVAFALVGWSVFTPRLSGASLEGRRDAPGAVAVGKGTSAPRTPDDGDRRPPHESDHDPGIPGLIVPVRTADVAASRDGVLRWVHADLGAEVQEGDIIAQLVNADALADLQVARAALDVARAERAATAEEKGTAEQRLARLDRMNQEGVASKEEYIAAEAEVRRLRGRATVSEAAEARAVADVSRRAVDVDSRVVRAPFAGIIARKLAEAGERIAAGSAVARLVASASRVRFGVTVDSVPCVRVGASITVAEDASRREGDGGPLLGASRDASPATEFRFGARVVGIAPEIDTDARLLWVEAEPVDPQRQLPLGARVEVDLTSGEGSCP